MIGKILGDRLFSSGIGGPFLCLKGGLTGLFPGVGARFITPLLSPFLLLTGALAPSVWALLLRSGCRDQRQALMQGKGFLQLLRENLGAALMGTLAWWAVLCGAYEAISWRTGVLAQRYAEAAMAHKVLQIATPEQLEYSQALLTMYAAAALLLMLIFSLIVLWSLAATLNLRAPFAHALRAFGANAPGYLLLAALAVCVFGIIEKEFAVLKLSYLEGYILGQERFNPTWPFLALRIWLSCAFMSAFGLMAALALRILALPEKKK
jgi:hypothetical protein